MIGFYDEFDTKLCHTAWFSMCELQVSYVKKINVTCFLGGGVGSVSLNYLVTSFGPHFNGKFISLERVA
jgi:hypothetical protein